METRGARLLFVCPNLGLAGAERQWSLLIPALRERGFQPEVLTLDGEGAFFDQLRDLGIPARCAWMRNRYDFKGLRKAVALGRAARPDIVFVRSVNALVIGKLIASRTGALIVSNERTDYALRPLRAHQLALMRLFAGSADAAIAPSPAQATSLSGVGYRPEQIHVIPNGAPIVQPTRSRGDVRRDLGLLESDFVVTLVAALRPEKRAQVFVESVTRAHRRNGRIRAVIVGGGPELHAIEDQARSSNGAVLVLGPRLDVTDLMSASDAVCLTSTHEAASNVILEGMALGKPVIATSIRGNAELVIDNETGILVPPGDIDAFALAFERLAADDSLAAALGRAGAYRHRSHFSFETSADAYAELLADVAARHDIR